MTTREYIERSIKTAKVEESGGKRDHPAITVTLNPGYRCGIQNTRHSFSVESMAEARRQVQRAVPCGCKRCYVKMLCNRCEGEPRDLVFNQGFWKCRSCGEYFTPEQYTRAALDLTSKGHASLGGFKKPIVRAGD